MKRPSGSKLPLLMECPASFALPWIDSPPSSYAIRGTVIHAFLETTAQNIADGMTPEDAAADALLDAPVETYMFLRALDLAALRLYLELLPEVAIAYDWRARTARYLGTGLDRAYGELGDTEIPFTIDLLGISETRVRVCDYKTGRTRYGRPEKFAQLLIGALGARALYGRDDAILELVYLDENSDAHVSMGEVDGWALDAFADELERAMDQLGEAHRAVAAGGLPDVRPGEHCVEMYCPAYRCCPAKSALVRHLPAHMAEVQQPGYLAPERLAQSWRLIQEVKRVTGMIEQEIRAQSMREPIDLGKGEMLGPRERRVESLDGLVSHAVLTRMLGAEYAAAAVTMETTKSAVEEQAKIHRDRNPKDENGKRVVLESKTGDGLLDRIYGEIRTQGGATVKVTNNPTVYKRKELP